MSKKYIAAGVALGVTAILVAGLMAATMIQAATGGSAFHLATASIIPHYREVTLPAGTVLPVALDSYVASDTSHIEDPVRAHLRHSVVVDGLTVFPAGSTLAGHVTSARRSGRVQGRAYLAFRFESLTTPTESERVDIHAAPVAIQARGTKKKDALTIGLPAAGGAVIGALLGGGKGAAIGGAAGGGAGTAYVLSTRGREVRLGPGAFTSIRLNEPLTVRVRTDRVASS
jgi:hypothetical protein